MSSVQRFLKQTQPGLSFVDVSNAIANAYDLVPGSGNVVGNYPNSTGYMLAAAGTGLASLLTNASESPLVGGGANTNAVFIRDMGKTLLAPIGSLTGNVGYFRQYQLVVLSPNPAATGQTFGVVGPHLPSTGGSATYATFYLPSPVAGVLAVGVTDQNQVAGGQM